MTHLGTLASAFASDSVNLDDLRTTDDRLLIDGDIVLRCECKQVINDPEHRLDASIGCHFFAQNSTRFRGKLSTERWLKSPSLLG
jgi:hypothetical protein